MNVIIVTGGTGGHIYPAVVLGESIADKKVAVNFITRKDPLAEKILKPSRFDFYYIEGKGFKKTFNPIYITSFILKFFIGLYQSFLLLLSKRPKLVIGMGGYLAPPVILSARLLLIPAIICEPNVIPGLANRFVAPIVNKIFVSFNKTRNYFPKGKVRIYPTPIRPAIVNTKREDAIEDLGLRPQRKTILVFGGSQGALSINLAMMDVLPYLTHVKGKIQIVHITGIEFFSWAKKRYTRGKYVAVILPYLEHMEKAYAAADLVISRSGASTIAEILARGLPSIFIPYPYAAGQHQWHNAQYLKESGAAVVIKDNELSGEKLASLILALLKDETKLEEMSKSSRLLHEKRYKEQLTIEDFLCKLYLKTNPAERDE